VFVVTLTYVAEIDLIDKKMDDHIAWLDAQYADGVFLASGARVPRQGGVILAAGLDRADLNRRLALDPFAEECLADYTVVEFAANRTKPGYENLGSASAAISVEDAMAEAKAEAAAEAATEAGNPN
jgi:uncharacterized protein YciI